MKTILLFFSLSCICYGNRAQEPIYNWGEPCTNDFTERKIDQLLSLGSDGFVLLRKHADITSTVQYWVEHYNSKLKLEGISEVAFNNGVKGNSFNIEKIDVKYGVIYAFITHWDKEANKHSLLIKQLSVDGELTDVAELADINAKKLGNKGFFNFSFSDDGSKLIVLSELPFEKKTNEKIKLSCFDVPSMKILWSHDQELAWPSKRAANNDIAVDNQGRAYFFKRIWQKPEWKYELYNGKDKDSWKVYPNLKLEGKEIVDYVLDFNKKNEFIMYGTVTTDPSHYNKFVQGSWFIHIDGSTQELTAYQSGWSKDILTRISGEKMAQKPDAHINDFYIKDVLHRDDGNFLVLMEQLREDKDLIPGSSPIQYSYKWNYGNFLALCVNPIDGKLIWWQSFNKHQEISSNEDEDQYGSFIYHLKEDRLYILWNNTDLSVPSIPPANWTEPDGTKYVKHKAFCDKTVHATFMQVIEPDGVLTYNNRKYGLPLFHLHEGAVFEMSVTTPFFFDLNGDLVIMAAMHNGGKRYRFGFIGL